MRPDEIVCELRRLAENSRSKHDVLVAAADLIESLQAQLAESQREKQAAVKDIMCRGHCDVCKYGKYDGGCDESDFNCQTCKNACACATCRDESNWKWRGPQEAGEGETE